MVRLAFGPAIASAKRGVDVLPGGAPLFVGRFRNEVRELCGSRYVFAPASSARAYKGNPAVSASNEVSLAPDQNSLDHVGVAVEYGRAGVAAVGVEICDEECGGLVVSHGCTTGKLGR